jgi:ABC-2 type transport system ATP-binding protein
LNTPIIETTDLTKLYGKRVGVTGLNLSVQQGEIFGFLGPNGAGKTTTIRTLLDFLRPTSGSARVFGLDSRQGSIEIRKRTGNLPGDFSIYRNMTGRQILEYSANLRGGVPEGEIERLAERLDSDLTRPVKAYSTGNRQKIGLIQAMMHKPELLMLDEPTAGLDPLVQQSLYELLEEVRDEGRTVFFSSHVLPEVEQLADRVGIIREGTLVAVETVAGLKHKATRRIDITFETPVPAEAFRVLPGVMEANARGPIVSLVVQGSIDPVVKAVAQHTVNNFVTYEPTLGEIFLGFYREEGQANVS